jgi:hypothetical protein
VRLRGGGGEWMTGGEAASLDRVEGGGASAGGRRPGSRAWLWQGNGCDSQRSTETGENGQDFHHMSPNVMEI